MRKLYIRFALFMLLIVMGASFVATVLAFVIANIFHFEEDFFLALRLRDLLVPIFTIASSAVLIIVISKKTVAPIVALSEAAKEVAQGNLDPNFQPSKRQDEIGTLERDFNLMLRELKSTELMRKDFIANISHEIKTPLAIIEGYAKLLAADEIGGKERRQYAHTIANESERLMGLSSNILRLSRINAQAIRTNRSRFRLDEQIRQAILFLEPAWEKRGIAFEIALYDQSYWGDEELLSQVWLNLLENAIKFSPGGGSVQIRLQRGKTGVHVEIEDHGIGMDEETCTRVFEQFFQGETSHAKEGNGLGLAIVKRIVELHDGDIQVESRVGEGTRITVLLPQPERR